MSHEVESMAYAHEVPWHGLGAQVSHDLSDEQMLVAAGLDWTVSKRALHFVGSDGKNHPVGNRRALVRDSDDRVLSTVGPDWRPVQNSETMQFFRRFVEAGRATLETAGSLREGRMVWALARLGEGFELPGRDRVRPYLLAASPHEGGKSAVFRTTAIRVVCANTLAMSNSETTQFEHRHSHVREFRVEEMSALFDGAREQMSEFEKNARVLADLNLSWEDCVRVLAPVYQPQAELALLLAEPKEWCPSLRSVMESYASAPGAVSGTGWGLLNGVTYHADHKAGRNADARLASAWVGTESVRKQRVMDTLLEMAV